MNPRKLRSRGWETPKSGPAKRKPRAVRVRSRLWNPFGDFDAMLRELLGGNRAERRSRG